MARVYISSTVADLEAEREAVTDWLVEADHQPVHSYRPNSETVRESCLDDIDGCDLYVLILGHRYGFQPEEDNPDKLSFCTLRATAKRRDWPETYQAFESVTQGSSLAFGRMQTPQMSCVTSR